MKLQRFLMVVVISAVSIAAGAALGGEQTRYIRGVGLSGLGNPACGRDGTCCPVCGSGGGYVHPWVSTARDPGHAWNLHHGWKWGLHGHGGYIQPGPPTAAITYPYYTLRGPRDFLQSIPTPIGP